MTGQTDTNASPEETTTSPTVKPLTMVYTAELVDQLLVDAREREETEQLRLVTMVLMPAFDAAIGHQIVTDWRAVDARFYSSDGLIVKIERPARLTSWGLSLFYQTLRLQGRWIATETAMSSLSTTELDLKVVDSKWVQK